MRDIRRRLKNVEKRLNLNEKPITIEIIQYCEGPLPPDRTVGNITISHVMYDEVAKLCEVSADV